MNEPIRLSEIIGKGYDEFWNTRARYRIAKGSRGSKKSTTAAIWYIYNMMKYPDSNLLVVRKVFATLKDSSYTQLLWAIDKLGVGKYWKATVNPLELTYKPTGQKILFRGMDDPLKITSIVVPRGYLCWIWCEEAYEISDEAAFDKLVMSIRGHIPASTGLFKQITLTFNPWRTCWIKDRFFDNPNESVFTMTSTYKDNEFLGPDDIALFEQMLERNPRAAQVAVLGEWGSGEDVIYSNWHEEDFNITQLKRDPEIQFTFGLDFGYVTSYNAFVAVAVDVSQRRLWVFDEMYERGMTNLDIAKKICAMGYGREEIWADCAEPKSIYELHQGLIDAVPTKNGMEYTRYALTNIRSALKGPDSVNNGIQRIQQFEIIVHPRCRNMIIELTNYSWEKDKDGKFTGKPEKEFDHLADALRYSMERFFIRGHGRIAEAKGRASPYETITVDPIIINDDAPIEVHTYPKLFEPDYGELCAAESDMDAMPIESQSVAQPEQPAKTSDDFAPKRKARRVASSNRDESFNNYFGFGQNSYRHRM